MLKVSFYRCDNGVLIGALSGDGVRLLETAHPATIAAAIFAMDVPEYVIDTGAGVLDAQLPASPYLLCQIKELSMDVDMQQWLKVFWRLSWVKFDDTDDPDCHAEIHFRTATHHLPIKLIRRWPVGPEPKCFRKELRKRNRSILYPLC
ncbi:hypothetical protein [Paraburkholderia adhaesiva]|uniref:hypothetical protein n=1 Tax=Paraburkholderia adhaesiva TaxID=2883244 RepID=UPI001F3E31CC|nr:hypothetical protein [Paraburkholderia adhaesiva]